MEVVRIGTRRWSKTAFELTERQRQVLRLIERGYSNGEIAASLGISLDGAKFHVSEILGKLEVSSREEAVAAWKLQSQRRAPVSSLVVALKWASLTAAGTVVVVAAAVAWATTRDTGPEPQSEASEATTTTAGVSDSPVRKSFARGEAIDISTARSFLIRRLVERSMGGRP